jgi:hypothetical protein
MTDFLGWLLEGREASVPHGVLAGYEEAFRDELVRLIRRTQNPTLKAHFTAMLDCPVRDSRGGCRSFSDYILGALIRNGVHRTSDIEAALGYVIEKMLMPVTDSGEPRNTVFGGFEERPDQKPDFNPLQARFLQFLQFAVNNLRKGKIPRVASFERRPQGTLSIGRGRIKDSDPVGEISPEKIPARQFTQIDLDDLVFDIKLLLRQKERALGLPLEEIFLAMIEGMRSEEQRKVFGDRTARMARKVIIDTVKYYADTSGSFSLLNMLRRLEASQGDQPLPLKQRTPQAVKPALTDKQRDYSSILALLDRLGRPAGSADLGRYRRRWLEYPPRTPDSGFRPTRPSAHYILAAGDRLVDIIPDFCFSSHPLLPPTLRRARGGPVGHAVGWRGGREMNEEQWLSCTYPTPMLEFLRTSGKLSERRARLFAAACCRRFWSELVDAEARRDVEVAERYANGGASSAQLEEACQAATALFPAERFVWDYLSYDDYAAAATAFTAAPTFTTRQLHDVSLCALYVHNLGDLHVVEPREPSAQVGSLRCNCGNPFRPVRLDPAWLSWNGDTVVRLAAAIYEERRLPGGTLDNGRLAVLADALEEAGCDKEDILSHCRSPNDHVRGCWVIDLALCKS